MRQTQPAAVMLRVGNEDIKTGSGGSFAHVSPVDGAFQGDIPLAGEADVGYAVAQARAAVDGWRRTAPQDRRGILLALADLIEAHVEEIVELASLEGGISPQAGRRMVAGSAEFHRYYAGWCDKVDGQVFSTPASRGPLSFSVPEPYGVVGVIITWNGPIGSLGMKAAPALAAGNCVIVKPSEQTPFVPDLYARLARQAGVPDGVLSVLPGAKEAGEALVAHPDVELITFTGGPVSAQRILEVCAKQMKPALLELGGKSAALVFPDVDIRKTSEMIIHRAMGFLSGQACTMPSRLLVHEAIYEEMLEALVEHADKLKVGDLRNQGVTVGPVINAAACDRILGMLDRVRDEGSGRIVCGGARCDGVLADGYFIEPTIIADPGSESEIFQVEVFGPVLTVKSFSDEDEAVALANATRYGLTSYIFTRDIDRVNRLFGRLRSGGVYVNGAPPTGAHLPFGGLGFSGYGKEGGRPGLDEFIRYKTVSIA